MATSLILSRLLSRANGLQMRSGPKILFAVVPRRNFIIITVDEDEPRRLDRNPNYPAIAPIPSWQKKEEDEETEFDVGEFGSDPYPYYRKVGV